MLRVLLDFLAGRKTYLVCGLALIYLVGSDLGWWPINEQVIMIFGFLGLGFLRSGVAKQGRDMTMLALLGLGIAAGTSGCGTIAPGQDAVVVRAEQTVEIAFAVCDTFLRFERENEADLPKGVHDFAEELRSQGPGYFRTARALTRSYKLSRSDGDRAALVTALAVVETAMREAQRHLAGGAKKGTEGTEKKR